MVVAETPLLVIGAALGRTGTRSTMIALETMGHKVYHGMRPGPWPRLWLDVTRAAKSGNGTWQDEAMDAFTTQLSDEGYTATLDTPMAALYPELMKRYPDAKVLLTLRDCDQWTQSVVPTVHRLLALFRRRPFCYIPGVAEWMEMRDWVFTEKLGVDESDHYKWGIPRNWTNGNEAGSVLPLSSTVALCDRFVAGVRGTVPTDRLVEFDVRQGWQPLCNKIGFYGGGESQVCPSEEGVPFPKANERIIFQIVLPLLQIIMWTWRILSCVVVCVGANLFLRVLRFCRASLQQNRIRQREHED